MTNHTPYAKIKIPNKCSIKFYRVYIFGFVYSARKERENIKSDYIPEENFNHILSALMPENRLALTVSLTTGLRIDDVLHLKTSQIQKQRFTIKEMKTGKTRRVNLSKGLWEELLHVAGRFYVFEHRTDPKKTRTRQAVNKDLKRACELFRIKGVNMTPHSARKIYAVNNFRRTCDIEKVRALLNHSEKQTEVTMLYAMADVLTERRTARKKVKIPQ